MEPADLPLAEHGTYLSYGRGCKCSDCRAANARHERDRKAGLLPPRPTLEQRLWAKVEKGDDCWMWQGGKNHLGYGVIWNENQRLEGVHRVAYRLVLGPFPAELEVCHRCDSPSCVRPDHLFLGTHAENMSDMKAKARSTQGERNPASKLTAEQVREIRALKGEADRDEVAAHFGISISHLNRLWRRELWTND